jgi:DNA (cytosine-5)-methyltransferase 1
MMDFPAGWVTEVPGIPRNAQLHAIGNGVLPTQASHALTGLLAARAAALADRERTA